jgi:hypothetical protein
MTFVLLMLFGSTETIAALDAIIAEGPIEVMMNDAANIEMK